MNKSIVIAALLIAMGLVGFRWSPRYTMTNIGDGQVIRLDHWTGAMLLCGHWSDSSFSCTGPVQYKDAERWEDITPRASRAAEVTGTDEGTVAAAQEARRAALQAADESQKAAHDAAEKAEAAMKVN